MHLHRRTLATAMALVTCAGTMLYSAAAYAEIPSGSPSFASASAPDALVGLNTWIAENAATFPDYVASVDDPASRAVTIYVHAATSTEQNQISSVAKASGISISVAQWPWTRTQIDQAAAQLDNQYGTWLSSYGFEIADVIGFDGKFSGLTVEGAWSSLASVSDARMSLMTSEAERIVGMPVQIIAGVTSGNALGRTTDVQPFYGGGLMASGSSICSNGFSINYEGSAYTLTARHCQEPNFHSYSGTTSNQYYSGSDVHLINSGAARRMGYPGTGSIWEGVYDTQNFTREVAGLEDVSVGDIVSTDGGNSGVHHDVEVTDLSVYYDDGTGYGTTEMIKGVQQGDDIAVIQGDSGGPVEVVNSAGNAEAVGMIQAYSGTTHTGSACGGAWALGSNICSNGVLFTSMRTIVNGLSGASLITGS